MKEIKCKIAQKGFCAGPVYRIEAAGEIQFAACENTEEENKKLAEVIKTLSGKLKEQAALANSENAKILEANQLLLEDDAFAAAIRKVLDEKKSKLAYAVQEGCRQLATSFENNESDYIRQRAADVRGLGKKLIDIAEGRTAGSLDAASIVVAEEMTPQEFAELDGQKILGLITVKGAVSSHVSIMAGNLGIPYAYQAESLSDLVSGAYVVIDSDAEKIILDPGEATKKEAEEKMKKLREEQEKLLKEAQNVKLKTKVYANISNAENLDALKESGAEGVGLFRSEFLFLEGEDAPTEESQYEAYCAVLKAMGDKEVIIRTMDIGSDKKASWVNIPDEKNPALGTRGVRLSFINKELFRTQLRALLRAATCGNLKIMFPMIASEWEVDEIRKNVNEVAEELKKEGIECSIPPLGIMVEVPAAALTADILAKKVDFFSIGTNDLTQYTLALDREAEGMEAFYLPHHEALIRLIRMVADAGHAAGIPVGICGELGADPEMIPVLVEAGVDELSVSVAKVKLVRAQVAKAEKELFVELGSPCDGKVIPMEEIADPVFASGALGQAIGVYPEEGTVYAPIAGKLVNLQDTKHAFTIEGDDGRQVLVHVGIDTVKLQGKGFTALAKEGDAITCGQPILKVDLNVIKESGYNPTVIVVAL